MITIDGADCPERLEQIRELFKEYAAGLGPHVTLEEFAREIRELPGEYQPPLGCLLLARFGGRAAGCVALRPLGGDIAEIRRMFVRHPFRSKGLGRRLTDAVLAEAARRGYRAVRLEALSWMTEALALYAAMGFRPVPPEGRDDGGTVVLEMQLPAETGRAAEL